MQKTVYGLHRPSCEYSSAVVFSQVSSPATHLDRLVCPVCAFSVGPLALLFSAILGGGDDASTVLNVVLPLTDILVAIGEGHGAVAFLFALSEVTFVGPTVLVGEPALPLEEVLGEGAFVSALGLGEIVDSLSLEHAINEVALIEASVSPLITTPSILLSLVVLAFKPDLALVPGLLSKAMLLVVHPFTFIGGAFRVDERAATIGHAIQPLTLINRTVGLDHAALPLHHVHSKLSLILGTILPDQYAQAVFDASPIYVAPLALILFGDSICVLGVIKLAVNVTLRLVGVEVYKLRF